MSSTEISKLVLSFVFGVGISSAVLCKIHLDSVKILRILYSIETITVGEIESIWAQSDLDSDLEYTLNDIASLLSNIYTYQENKIMGLRDSSYSSFIIELYRRLGLINNYALDTILAQLQMPLHLQRCRTIVQQLRQDGVMMTKMMIPSLLVQSCLAKKDFIHMMPTLMRASLENDLYDFLRIQELSGHNTPLLSHDSLRDSANLESTNSSFVLSDLASYQHDNSPAVGKISPIKDTQSNSRRDHKKSRKSDIFDYMSRM